MTPDAPAQLPAEAIAFSPDADDEFIAAVLDRRGVTEVERVTWNGNVYVIVRVVVG